MMHYWGVSVRALKRQKLLTILTVIAVALSVALISVLGILSDALSEARIAQAESLSGRHHVQYKDLTDAQLDTLRKDKSVEQIGITRMIGSAALPGETFSVNIEEMDQAAFHLLSLQLAAGAIPENSNEIVLEEQTLKRLGIQFEKQKRIELPVEQFLKNEDGSYSSNGIKQMEFSLVGVLKDHPATVSGRYGVGVAGIGSLPELQNPTNAFVRFKKNVNPVLASDQLLAQLSMKESQMNGNDWLLSALGYSGYESDEKGDGFGRGAMLIGGLVLFAACLVIYNIFQVSVVQRTRQFGMLRAVGATPAQVRRLVLLEALILCGIGIPIGLMSGILSSRAVAGSVGALISPDAFGVETAQQAIDTVKSHVGIPWMLVGAAAAIGLVATLLSAYLPARLASRVSPVTAISGLVGSGAGASVKRRRASKPRRSILWHTARLNLSRNRTRTTVTVASLAMAILTFVALQSFSNSLNTMEMLKESMDSEYSLSSDQSIKETDIERLRALPGVDHVRTARVAAEPLDIEAQRKANLKTAEESKAYAVAHIREVIGVDEETLQGLLNAMGKTAPRLQDLREKPLALVWNNEVNRRMDPNWKPSSAGTTIPVFGNDVTVAGIVENLPIHRPFTPIGSTLIMHETQAQQVASDSKIKYADVFLDKDITLADKTQVEQTMQQIKESNPACTLASLESVKEELEKGITAIRSLGYGLIALVSIIGALGIVNTTLTSLHTRQAELGMMRAIGMSERQMNRMVLLESLHYGLLALLIGLPVGIGLSALVMAMTRGLDYWQPPIMQALIASLCAMVLCLLAAWPPLLKMKKISIVESIGRVD